MYRGYIGIDLGFIGLGLRGDRGIYRGYILVIMETETTDYVGLWQAVVAIWDHRGGCLIQFPARLFR